MILGEGEAHEAKTFAGKMRKGAETELIREIIVSGKLPAKWNTRAEGRKGPEKFDLYGVSSWAKTKEGREALNAYIKNRGPIAFRGIANNEQLELIIWDNMLEPMKHLVIGDGDINGRMYREKMAEHVTQFKKDYGELFILKLMAPQTEAQTVTYFKAGTNSAKILPAFKSESLSYIKLGLRFFNQSKAIDPISKETFFNFVSAWHNNSFRAFYGQRGDHTNPFTTYLSDLTNQRLDIMRGSPLLDDITPYDYSGGLQQRHINPHVARALGLETNESIASFLYNEPLFAKDIQTLRETSLMSYLPRAYINPGVSGRAHPSIHGYKSYNRAVRGAASALLGDALNQNLVFDKSFNHFKGAYNNILESDGGGRKGADQTIDAKVNCFN